MPHKLVESFKATLAEAINADLLIHVVDVSSDEVYAQIESVESVLKEIGAESNDMMVVFNKIDALTDMATLESLKTIYPEAVSVSAKLNHNVDLLRERVAGFVKGKSLRLMVTSRISDGRLQSFLHASTEIVSQEYTDEFVLTECKIGTNKLKSIKQLGPENIEIIS